MPGGHPTPASLALADRPGISRTAGKVSRTMTRCWRGQDCFLRFAAYQLRGQSWTIAFLAGGFCKCMAKP